MTAPSSLCSRRLRPSITSLPQGLQCEAEIKAEINVTHYLHHHCPLLSLPVSHLLAN